MLGIVLKHAPPLRRLWVRTPDRSSVARVVATAGGQRGKGDPARAGRREKPGGDLGARYRRLRTRLGGVKAVKAMARYLACLIYRLLTKGAAWVDRGATYYEKQCEERELLACNVRPALRA
jgi:hypothetical protein